MIIYFETIFYIKQIILYLQQLLFFFFFLT